LRATGIEAGTNCTGGRGGEAATDLSEGSTVESPDKVFAASKIHKARTAAG